MKKYSGKEKLRSASVDAVGCILCQHGIFYHESRVRAGGR